MWILYINCSTTSQQMFHHQPVLYRTIPTNSPTSIVRYPDRHPATIPTNSPTSIVRYLNSVPYLFPPPTWAKNNPSHAANHCPETTPSAQSLPFNPINHRPHQPCRIIASWAQCVLQGRNIFGQRVIFWF